MAIAPTNTTTEPTLHNGDRLSLDEFLDRWEQRSDIRHAELIDGTVYIMPSPVSIHHGEPHSAIIRWLGAYELLTSGLLIYDNVTYTTPQGDSVQPDLAVTIPASAGGKSSASDRGYLQGSPEFIAEVSYTSASYDVNQKRDAYEAAGVGEYFVWRIVDDAIDWWRRDGERFVEIPRDAADRRHSTILPGLLLDDGLLRSRDFAGLLSLMQSTTADNAEHAALKGHVAGSG